MSRQSYDLAKRGEYSMPDLTFDQALAELTQFATPTVNDLRNLVARTSIAQRDPSIAARVTVLYSEPLAKNFHGEGKARRTGDVAVAMAETDSRIKIRKRAQLRDHKYGTDFIKNSVRGIITSLSLAVTACSPETASNSQAAKDYARLCSEEGMLDGANRTRWLELTAAIDRGEIQREQVSLAPQIPSFSSDDRNSLEARVEASVGDVAPVAGSNSDDGSGLFQGALVVLLDGAPIVVFRDLYLATDNENWIDLYGRDMKLRNCFLDRGANYSLYIGRQK